MKKMLATAAILSAATSAFAVDFAGPGFALPDLVGGSSSLTVVPSFSITDADVSLNALTHTWVGDLTATVTHGAQSAILFARPGSDGTGVGSGNNLDGTYRFDSSAATSFSQSATANAVQPSGTYDTSNPGVAGAGNSALDVFNGTNSAGLWTLTITDSAAADIGNLGSWTLHLVPEPTSLSLLALAGLALIRRR